MNSSSPCEDCAEQSPATYKTNRADWKSRLPAGTVGSGREKQGGNCRENACQLKMIIRSSHGD